MRVQINRKPNNGFSVSMIASLEEAYLIKGMTGMVENDGGVRVYTNDIYNGLKNAGLNSIIADCFNDGFRFELHAKNVLDRVVAAFKVNNTRVL